MVQKNIRLRTSAEIGGEMKPGEWITDEEMISYSDLPVPDEIGSLFESEPPLASPARNGSSPDAALLVMGGGATDGGVSTSQALVATSHINQERYVVFILAGSRYAVPMSQVFEVAELVNSTPVPNVPEWIMGVTNLRGDIVSIVDIRALINLDHEEYADANTLLVTHTFEGDITACLVVEHVVGIADINALQIQHIDSMVEDRLGPYVRGIHAHSEGLVSVINLEGLLHSLDVAHYKP